MVLPHSLTLYEIDYKKPVLIYLPYFDIMTYKMESEINRGDTGEAKLHDRKE